MPEMLWAFLCVALVSALNVPRRLVPALDPLADLEISRKLDGSNFELESDANIKVDTAGQLDFATAPAQQFWRGPTADLIVAGGYRELVPANNGVFFYLYWITRTARQGIKIQFRAQRDTLTPLDIQVGMNPLLGLVELELWQCDPAPIGCRWGDFNNTGPWQMDPTVAYFSYNAQVIPGLQTSLVTSAAAPSWFLTQQTAWRTSGIPVGTYGKAGINLKRLPCYATQQCADWDWISIVYSATEIDTFQFQNGYCSHISFEKASLVGNRSLANAVFGLYLPYLPGSIQKGAKVGECTTDQFGRCSIKTNMGQRVVYEDIPPPDYLPIQPFIVNVPENGMQVFYALKDREADSEGIKIQKISGVTGQLVSGASFLLRQHLTNGTTVEWRIENASSTFCTDYPPAGSNWKLQLNSQGCVFLDIIEDKPPVGFKAITIINATFCVTTGKEDCKARGPITVKDLPTPQVTLRKVGDGGVSVTGTVLGLSMSGDPNQDYNAIPNYAKCTVSTTTATGSCKLYAPTLGRYWVVEIKPNPRYKRAPPQGPFDIVDGGTYDFTVNDPLLCYGAPTIRRLDCNGNPVDLLGSVYQVTSGTTSSVFTNTDGYTRYCFANGTEIFPLDDDCCGDFTITEITPPEGQAPASPATKTIHYCRVSSSGSSPYPACDDRPIDLTFQPQPCSGTFRLTKTGPNGPVNGARFRLYNSNGYSSIKTVDINGYACWTDVPTGANSLQEVFAPPGYLLDHTIHPINIQPTSNDDSCESPTASAELENAYENFYIKISKKRQTYAGYSGTTDALVGAQFLIVRVTGETWQRTVTITDPSGILCVQLPSPGTYQIKETTPPSGFQLSEEVKQVTISDGNTCDTATVFTFTDIEITTTTAAPTTTPVVTGTLRLSKTGPDGPVPDARFRLWNAGYSIEKTIDSNGYACWTGVPKGSYSLLETFAPPGYLLDNTIRNVVVNPSSSDNSCEEPSNEVEVENAYENFYVQLSKLRAGTSQYLVGAEFTIDRVTGETFSKTVQITASGPLCVQLPTLGTYNIKETKAPAGYSISPEVKTVTITDGNTCATAVAFSFSDTEVTTTTQPPTTTPTPTPTPFQTCALRISVYGTRSSYAGSEPLPQATLQLVNSAGVTSYPDFTTSNVACVNIPLGTYSLAQISPPPSGNWQTTDLPRTGACNTVSSCPNAAATVTITYNLK